MLGRFNAAQHRLLSVIKKVNVLGADVMTHGFCNKAIRVKIQAQYYRVNSLSVSKDVLISPINVQNSRTLLVELGRGSV